MEKTQQNLLKAFAGESMARNKYTFFAKQARKEGEEWVARVFEETADNERAHAEELVEKITKKVGMTNSYEVDPLATTIENLRHGASGEKFEWGSMYPEFKQVAEEEGATDIASLFQEISEVEEKHEERYNILADKLELGSLHKSESEVEWKCLNCGYVHKGTDVPDSCPVCKKPKGWYMQIGLLR